MAYFLVKGSEDGTRIYEVKDEAALKQLIEDCGITEFRQGFGNEFRDRDPNYWPEKTALIIKGEVINPKPKQVVQDWEF